MGSEGGRAMRGPRARGPLSPGFPWPGTAPRHNVQVLRAEDRPHAFMSFKASESPGLATGPSGVLAGRRPLSPGNPQPTYKLLGETLLCVTRHFVHRKVTTFRLAVLSAGQQKTGPRWGKASKDQGLHPLARPKRSRCQLLLCSHSQETGDQSPPFSFCNSHFFFFFLLAVI